MRGYVGKVLNVDLSSGEILEEELEAKGRAKMMRQQCRVILCMAAIKSKREAINGRDRQDPVSNV